MEILTNEREIVQQLEQYGFKQYSDFHLEPIYELTSYIGTINCVNITESDYEKGNYNATNHEKRKIGVQILNSKFEPIKLEKLIETVKKLPNPKYGLNQCGICGKKVIVSRRGVIKDNRSLNQLIRCFDHIGVKNEDD